MDKASEFRAQAAALREAAAFTQHQITRQTLLKMAAEYDRMADKPLTTEPKQLPRFFFK